MATHHVAADIDTTTPAVILKFDQNLMHHGGLGAIRSLGRLGVPVYGVHEEPWAPAAASRYLHGRWIWHPDAGDVERTQAGLLALAERIGRRAVLIPTDDAGAIFLAEHGSALRKAFLFPAPPPGLPRRVAGKFSMHELCREAGAPCPSVTMPGTLAEARDFATGSGYPVVAKLSTPWSASGAGLRSTSIIHSADELAGLWRACELAGAGLMLQDFIPAVAGGDWFFHGYCDVNSACRPAFTGVKVRSYPAHAGLTSFGLATANDQLRTEMIALLSQLSYRGIVDLDLRRDARDGQYKLLDFNPRLGAQFRLFRDSAGLDVVLAAYLDLTGQVIPAGTQLNGRGFLVENYDPIGALSYWRSGELRLRPWLASLRQADEVAWFARDDLRPFGLMCARMGVRGIARRFLRPKSPAAKGRAPRYLAGRATGQQANPGSHPARPGGHPAFSNSNHDIGAAAGAGPLTRGTNMDNDVDVAIVGAGPYGLSLAAHLREAGVSFRQFGLLMNPWRTAMPQGMFLKSQGFASNLSDPKGTHTLEAFCSATDRPYASYGLPVPLDVFVAYGQWFQAELVPDLEQTLVTAVSWRDSGYRVELATGETVAARRVVVAAGIEHFPFVPPELTALPDELCTHSSQHTDLAMFRGRRVIVVGGGQSALESAALLHENGAYVQIVMRKPKMIWNGAPLDPDRPLLRRLREPEAGLGSGWGTWFYSNHPGLFRHLAQSTRIYRARTALGPAGASWLRGRVEGEFPAHTGESLRSARPGDGGVRLALTGSGRERELAAEHVIAATGYRADVRRLDFIGDRLRASIRTVAGTPAVDRDYQSSVPGLYFAGPGVAPTFGPVMRFVFGADHAARTLSAKLTRTASTRGTVGVKAAR